MKYVLTEEEKQILYLALQKLREHYDDQESRCRDFKWICHKQLMQSETGFLANKNVIDIQDETIKDIHRERKKANDTIKKIINAGVIIIS